MFPSCTEDGTAASDKGAGGVSTSAAVVQEGAFLLMFLVFLMLPLFLLLLML